MKIEQFPRRSTKPTPTADYSDAQRVLRHRQVMKPETVTEAAILVEFVTLSGMVAFATALPRSSVRLQPSLRFDGQA